MAPGTPLDATIYECATISGRNYPRTLSSDAKQALKMRIWRVGSILKAMHNMLWVHHKVGSVGSQR